MASVLTVAALYDIHGNVPALDAVLSEVPDDAAIVVGGDIVGGPQASEAIARLRALGERVLWLSGNAEREVVTGGVLPDPTARAVFEWEAGRLSAEDREFLAGLPAQQQLAVEGFGQVLFCHGSPRSDVEMITAITQEARLREILEGVEESVVVCGHTHHHFDRTVDGTRIVNAGSVGMAYEGRPGAYWALLGPDVELRRTEYDLEAAVEAVRESGYPDPDNLIENLTEPPTAATVAEHFESRALETSR